MEREPLTEDELEVIACAIRYPGGFAVEPLYLADAHRMHQRGWLDRRLEAEHVVFSLSARGVHALEVGVPLAEAKEAMN